jgi:hypothetical protein
MARAGKNFHLKKIPLRFFSINRVQNALIGRKATIYCKNFKYFSKDKRGVLGQR